MDGRPLQRISRSFKTALKDAGILDFRFHDLQHCASTDLRRAGVDTATAVKIVGHKLEKIWKRYNAIKERDLTQAAQKVHKYLQEKTSRLRKNSCVVLCPGVDRYIYLVLIPGGLRCAV
ncbi:MAG: tyrosine-type recombinase/integrase, partial [Nitrospira sp.]|nr:tyrosine-type recombinase/integrase [Nitrospira sp.]